MITPDRLAFADSPTRGKSAHACRRIRNIERTLAAGIYRTGGGEDLRVLLREAQVEAGHAVHYLTR